MRVKSRLVRQRILDVAGELFVLHGFGTVSMSQVSATLGGSKSTLYNHFKSKEDLFEAYVVEAGRERFAALAEIDPANGDLTTVLTGFGRAYLGLLLSPGVLAVNRLVIAEAKRFPAIGQIFHEHGPRQTIDRIVEVMQVLSDRGLITTDDIRMTAFTFKAMAETDLYEKCLWGLETAPAGEAIAAAADAAVSAFLACYGTDAALAASPSAIAPKP
jgi:TetR/AcrR family transcriptional repressor of mexJK operon